MNQITIYQTVCLDGKEHSKIEDAFNGEILCQKCGMVLEEKMVDYDPAYMEYDKSSTSMNIGQSNQMSKDMSKIKPAQKLKFESLRKWDNQIRARGNLDERQRQESVAKYCSKLKLPPAIVSDVNKYMTKIRKERLARGREQIEFMAATIFYVCKIHEVPKTMSDISLATNVSTKKMYQILRIINESFGTVNKVQDIESFIPQFASRLNMPEKYVAELYRLVKILKKENFHHGKTPSVLIATLVRLISINTNDFVLTKSEIANACDISDVAMTGMFKKVNHLAVFT